MRALADEPDEIATFVIELVHRQPAIVDELPRRIDDANRARDTRLTKRLVSALVKSDDERKHWAWLQANYPALANS